MNKIKLAIASGKGGTGKTLLSTNLFHALQQNGNNVALVDCDAEEPNAKLFFDGLQDNEFDVKQNISVIDDKPKAFVVMQFTEQFNELFDSVIKPVCESIHEINIITFCF